MKKVTFQSGKNKIAANLLKKDNAKYGVLFLHGGGSATKERFASLQQFLSTKGFSSLTFDFQGVGESEGKFAEGSLNNRLLDAQAAFDTFSQHVDSIIVVGSSMGGHIASRLSETRKPLAVILLYPAAYAKEAENKPLDESFTKILRTENSWQNSTAFTAIKQYQGNVLVIYGEYDSVVPKGVQEKYKELVKDKGKFIILENASHVFTSPKTAREIKANELAFSHIASYLNKL